MGFHSLEVSRAVASIGTVIEWGCQGPRGQGDMAFLFNGDRGSVWNGENVLGTDGGDGDDDEDVLDAAEVCA